MKSLYNWKARRAGGRITIIAKDAHGDDCKVVGVDVIEVTPRGICATDRTGAKFDLATTC